MMAAACSPADQPEAHPKVHGKEFSVDVNGMYSALLIRLIFTLAPLLVWLLLSLLALFSLRGRALAGTALALWVLIIVAVPFLGALAVWIVRPTDGSKVVEVGPQTT
jgi:hypothetical protein